MGYRLRQTELREDWCGPCSFDHCRRYHRVDSPAQNEKYRSVKRLSSYDSRVPGQLWLAVLLIILALPSASCSKFVKTEHPIPANERPFKAETRSRAELLSDLERRSASVKTLSATVTLDAAAGALTEGVLTEYRQTKGFVLVERPTQIRIKAQAPLVGTTVFDMVSDGRQYRASIPIKNKFLVGDSNAPGNSKNPVLNLRPSHILDALFVDIIPYMKDSNVKPVLEEEAQGRYSYYVFLFINFGSENAQLIEKVWIDRRNLEI